MTEARLRRLVVGAALGRLVLSALPFVVAALTGARHGALPHWDALYYARLAAHGYGSMLQGDRGVLAFFPLFPLVASGPIHLGLPPDVAVVLVADLSAFAATVALALLVAREWGTTVAARAVVLFLAVPASFFLSVGYSEGPFLALSLCAFMALRRHRWSLAALLCGLAAVTRPTGVALAIPYLVEWWSARRALVGGGRSSACSSVGDARARFAAHLPGGIGGEPRKNGGDCVAGQTATGAAGLQEADRRALDLHALTGLILLVLPLALYALYDWRLGVGPLPYLTIEREVWKQSWNWPWVTAAKQIAVLGSLDGSGLAPVGLLNLVSLLLAAPLLVAALVKLPATYRAYALVSTVLVAAIDSALPFYVGGHTAHAYSIPLTSTHRLLLAAFPLFIAAALLIRRTGLLLVVAALLFLGQLLVATLFVHDVFAG